MGLNILIRFFKDYYKIYFFEEMLEIILIKNLEINGLFNMNYRLEEWVGDLFEFFMVILVVVILFVIFIDDWFVGVFV